MMDNPLVGTGHRYGDLTSGQVAGSLLLLARESLVNADVVEGYHAGPITQRSRSTRTSATKSYE
jgi:hypothetical protein